MSDTRKRSLVKGLSYRALGSATTVAVAVLVTGSLPASLVIGGVELVSKIGLFYAHERLWSRIRWGLVRGQAAETPADAAITPPQIVRAPAIAGGAAWPR